LSFTFDDQNVENIVRILHLKIGFVLTNRTDHNRVVVVTWTILKTNQQFPFNQIVHIDRTFRSHSFFSKDNH